MGYSDARRSPPYESTRCWRAGRAGHARRDEGTGRVSWVGPTVACPSECTSERASTTCALVTKQTIAPAAMRTDRPGAVHVSGVLRDREQGLPGQDLAPGLCKWPKCVASRFGWRA